VQAVFYGGRGSSWSRRGKLKKSATAQKRQEVIGGRRGLKGMSESRKIPMERNEMTRPVQKSARTENSKQRGGVLKEVAISKEYLQDCRIVTSHIGFKYRQERISNSSINSNS